MMAQQFIQSSHSKMVLGLIIKCQGSIKYMVVMYEYAIHEIMYAIHEKSV